MYCSFIVEQSRTFTYHLFNITKKTVRISRTNEGRVMIGYGMWKFCNVVSPRGGQKKPKFNSELAKLIFPLNMVM